MELCTLSFKACLSSVLSLELGPQNSSHPNVQWQRRFYASANASLVLLMALESKLVSASLFNQSSFTFTRMQFFLRPPQKCHHLQSSLIFKVVYHYFHPYQKVLGSGSSKKSVLKLICSLKNRSKSAKSFYLLMNDIQPYFGQLCNLLEN